MVDFTTNTVSLDKRWLREFANIDYVNFFIFIWVSLFEISKFSINKNL